jgi:hypothetical protein
MKPYSSSKKFVNETSLSKSQRAAATLPAWLAEITTPHIPGATDLLAGCVGLNLNKEAS